MTIFEEAEEITTGARRASYGPIRESAERVAHAWTGLLLTKLKEPITAEDFCRMMAAMKLCRDSHSLKRDNWVDAVGYMRLLERIVEDDPEDAHRSPLPQFVPFEPTPENLLDGAAETEIDLVAAQHVV